MINGNVGRDGIDLPLVLLGIYIFIIYYVRGLSLPTLPNITKSKEDVK